jgi:ABC-type Na+ efflux pump permease subunit
MLSTSIEIVSLIISELLFIFICSVISLIIGNMFDENRDFKTFIFMLIIYLSLRLIVLSVIEIFNLNYYAYTTILFLILSIILYFIGRKLFKKGINLEY